MMLGNFLNEWLKKLFNTKVNFSLVDGSETNTAKSTISLDRDKQISYSTRERLSGREGSRRQDYIIFTGYDKKFELNFPSGHGDTHNFVFTNDAAYICNYVYKIWHANVQ